MKLIVAGSRDLPEDFDLDALACIVEEALRSWGDEVALDDITSIVSGKARGVDRMGEALAAVLGVPVDPFVPDYGKHGRYLAPKIRNEQMAAHGDRLVAVRYNGSRGTTDMIDRMRAHGKPFFVKDITG